MNELTQFLMSHGGPVLFGIVFAEQAGLPLPSAPWLLAAGALSAAGKLNPLLALAMTVLACVVADSIWFFVGRRGGQRVLRLFCRLSLAPNACVGRTKGLFARHGLQALIAAKFIPGLGAVMPPLAGALGVSAGRFLLLDSVGSLVYGSFYIVAGFLFHNQLQYLLATLEKLGFSSLLLALALVPAYVVFKYVQRGRPARARGQSMRLSGSRGPSSSDAALRTISLRDPEPAPSMTISLADPAQGALASTARQTARVDPPASLVQVNPCGL